MASVPLLLLRLEGPLQSWGLRSRWDVRDTGDEPSKSGIIGLLGCAMGLGALHPDLADLDRQLMLGIRVENAGRRLVDYQTVTGLLPDAMGGVKGSIENPATIISPRAYLQDAAFLAVLGGPATVLERCQAALARPRWPVYLGRKSCPPTRPVLVGVASAYESVEDALRRHPWDWYGRGGGQPDPMDLPCVLESAAGTVVRPDRVPSNPTRMYGTRMVSDFHVSFPGAVPLGEGKEGEGPCFCLS